MVELGLWFCCCISSSDFFLGQSSLHFSVGVFLDFFFGFLFWISFLDFFFGFPFLDFFSGFLPRVTGTKASELYARLGGETLAMKTSEVIERLR